MKNAFNKRTVVICILCFLSIALSLEVYKFVKLNTGIILWDYQIASEAFLEAQEKSDEGKTTDEQIVLELAEQAFNPIRQTRDLTKPLLIRSKWYSHNLHEFLFECSAARDLSDEEVQALVNKIDNVSEELNKIKWEDIQTDGSLIGQKHEIFETIENVDKLLD